MTFCEDSDFGTCPDAFGAHIPTTSQEIFVNSVYSSVDEAVRFELNRLCIKDRVITTCKLGCYHCCGQYILMTVAEAHALAQYVKREFSIDQITDLRLRTQQWHEWNDSRPGRYPSTNIDVQTVLSDYHPYCPMLVKGACSAYPVRPVICRTHFVCSDPSSCRPSNDPEPIGVDPLALTSIVTATSPFSMRIRDSLKTEGLDLCQSVMLLPHCLSIEMGWDFAVSL
jgi:Fe-S-cluster containining protein